MNTKSLHEVIAHRLEAPLADFARQHPHLAAAVDRMALVESTVRRLSDDPEYRRAMEQAAVDDATLEATARVAALIDRCVTRLLGI